MTTRTGGRTLLKVEDQANAKDQVFVPHPDDLAEVRSGLDAAEQGDVLSDEEAAEFLADLASPDADR